MSTAEREPWRQSSVTTASDESALMEKVAGIVSRTMSDHYGDKLTFEVGVERHFESWGQRRRRPIPLRRDCV